MDRDFNIGDIVLCVESGVVGTVLKFYTPTSCEEQTKVITDDGRMYHAPTSYWVKYAEGSLGPFSPPIMRMSDVPNNFKNTNVVIIPNNTPQTLIDKIRDVLAEHYIKAIYGGER